VFEESLKSVLILGLSVRSVGDGFAGEMESIRVNL
jgi:hypothetical protein